jgi:hypothetical protein
LLSYLEREALDLIPADNDATAGHVELISRLATWFPIEGPYTSRAIYISPSQPKPKPARMVIRQIEWQSREDFDRVRDQRALWPSIDVSYYDVEEPSRRSLRRSLSALQRTLDGQRTRTADDSPSTQIAGAEPLSDRRRREHRSVFLHLELDILERVFREADNPSLDKAWSKVWTLLSRECSEERETKRYAADYLIPPEELARFMFDSIDGTPTLR